MCIMLVISCIIIYNCIANLCVEPLIVPMGDYPGITGAECGLRYVANKIPYNYPTKCFQWQPINGSIDDIYRDFDNSATNGTTNGAPIADTKARDVEYSEAPFAVFIKYYTRYTKKGRLQFGEIENIEFHCTGALINSQWVVTAAHCNLNPTTTGNFHKNIRVFIGNNEHREGGMNVVVKNESVYRHPNYTLNLYGPFNLYDIALYKLDQNIDINGTINGLHYLANTVCLPQQQTTGHLNSNQEMATVYGWGHTAHEGTGDSVPNTQVLQKTVVALEADMLKCNGMLCSVKNESITNYRCVRDPGAPLIQYTDIARTRAVLIGVSSGRRCFDGGYEVTLWTPVASNVNWILDTIAKH